MKVGVLAAGYGTRLYPLTCNIAKPLIPVNQKPLLNFLFDKIYFLKKKFPIDEVRVIVNDKFYKDFLIWRKKYRVKATIINDGSKTPDERLGAIKDMQLIFGKSDVDWLVLGGDNLFDDNLVNFLKFSLQKKSYPAIGLYDVKSRKEAVRFGIVSLNWQKRIVSFREKPKKPVSTLAAACVYFFPKGSSAFLSNFIKEHEKIDAAGRYIAWLVGETKVFGYALKGNWVDIGHFNSLKEAQRLFNPADSLKKEGGYAVRANA